MAEGPGADIRQPVMQLLAVFAQLPDENGELYRVLRDHGRWMGKAVRLPPGLPKQCTQNSIALQRPCVWCGVGVPKGLPVWHCWTTETDPSTGELHVLDPTWQPPVPGTWYFGMPVPLAVATEIWQTARHGDQLLDAWRSAVRQAPDGAVEIWRGAIIAAQHETSSETFPRPRASEGSAGVNVVSVAE